MNRTNVIEDLNLLPLPPWWVNPWFIVACIAGFAALVGLGIWAARRRPAKPTAPVTPTHSSGSAG